MKKKKNNEIQNLRENLFANETTYKKEAPLYLEKILTNNE